MNNTYCNIIKKGLFVSHQGVSLCCINPLKHQMKPSEFWYGDSRKLALDRMTKNKEVKGCEQCYIAEKNKIASARIFYNSYKELPNGELPTMVDLDFSNFCNLKCIMCNSTRSSEWAKDEGKGISVISKDLIDDLFSISKDVVQMTIQGGEPSIMHEYEYYFELLDKADIAKNIDLQVITNATNVNNRFYSLLEKFKSVRLSVSIDAFGLANDYIRWPSKFNQIEKNLLAISDLKENIEVEVLNTINLLSMLNYDEFLNWAKKIENHYNKKGKIFKLIPMKIQFPKEYSPFYAPEQLKNKFISDIKEFTKKNKSIYNSNWKTEMLLIAKQIEKSKFDNSIFEIFKKKINFLNKQRKIEEITDFFPTYYNFF